MVYRSLKIAGFSRETARNNVPLQQFNKQTSRTSRDRYYSLNKSVRATNSRRTVPCL